MFKLKQIGLAIAAAALVVPAFAQNAPPPAGAPANQPAPQAASKPLNIDPFFDAVDTNKDGCMSREEWLAAGLVDDTYTKVGNGAKCITRKMMAESNPPAMLDGNGDGILTLAEVQAFLKKSAANKKDGAPNADQKGPAPDAKK
jgi:hypothetical protein